MSILEIRGGPITAKYLYDKYDKHALAHQLFDLMHAPDKTVRPWQLFAQLEAVGIQYHVTRCRWNVNGREFSNLADALKFWRSDHETDTDGQ